MIIVKILGTKSHLRYSVRRLVEAAQRTLVVENPDLELNITEITKSEEIAKYTPILVAPGLVINEKLVYDLWIPQKEQVIGWIREAMQDQLSKSITNKER
jgi:hypothetical protein